MTLNRIAARRVSRPYGRRPPYRRSVRLGFACVAAMVVHGALFTAAALTLSPHAHSAPASSDQEAFQYWAHHGTRVCRTLDAEPSVDGIVTAALDIYVHGLNTKQAGQVIALAIHYTCPQHQHLITEYQAAQPRIGVLA